MKVVCGPAAPVECELAAASRAAVFAATVWSMFGWVATAVFSTAVWADKFTGGANVVSVVIVRGENEVVVESVVAVFSAVVSAVRSMSTLSCLVIDSAIINDPNIESGNSCLLATNKRAE